MTIAMRVLSAAAASFLITAGLAVFSLLQLMFQTTEDEAYKEGLFGAVFIRVRPLDDGGVVLTAGVHSYVSLAVIWLVMLTFVLLVIVIYRQLKMRRRMLLEKQDNTMD